jgi:Domain of unknown function (DUF4430)
LGHWPRRLAAATLAVALAGCGLGPGPSTEGTATLTVTRDYGTVKVIETSVDDPDESETVLRMLDREADIETRYGGGFVQSIEGVAGGTEGDRRLDWFFYVNGIESPVGSAERAVRGGDRIWWDHHDWTDAMRVPAVVGSWPEPFLQFAADEERLPVRVECAADEPDACRTAAERLSDEGVSVGQVPYEREPGEEALRVLVGTWEAIRSDPAAGQIADGPAASGVFARFAGARRAELLALDERARTASRLGRGAGLVAAVRDGEDPPTWVVSGVDASGVAAAADALDTATLADRYAVVVAAGSEETLPVPVVEGSG